MAVPPDTGDGGHNPPESEKPPVSTHITDEIHDERKRSTFRVGESLYVAGDTHNPGSVVATGSGKLIIKMTGRYDDPAPVTEPAELLKLNSSLTPLKIERGEIPPSGRYAGWDWETSPHGGVYVVQREKGELKQAALRPDLHAANPTDLLTKTPIEKAGIKEGTEAPRTSIPIGPTSANPEIYYLEGNVEKPCTIVDANVGPGKLMIRYAGADRHDSFEELDPTELPGLHLTPLEGGTLAYDRDGHVYNVTPNSVSIAMDRLVVDQEHAVAKPTDGIIPIRHDLPHHTFYEEGDPESPCEMLGTVNGPGNRIVIRQSAGLDDSFTLLSPEQRKELKLVPLDVHGGDGQWAHVEGNDRVYRVIYDASGKEVVSASRSQLLRVVDREQISATPTAEIESDHLTEILHFDDDSTTRIVRNPDHPEIINEIILQENLEKGHTGEHWKFDPGSDHSKGDFVNATTGARANFVVESYNIFQYNEDGSRVIIFESGKRRELGKGTRTSAAIATDDTASGATEPNSAPRDPVLEHLIERGWQRTTDLMQSGAKDDHAEAERIMDAITAVEESHDNAPEALKLLQKLGAQEPKADSPAASSGPDTGLLTADEPTVPPKTGLSPNMTAEQIQAALDEASAGLDADGGTARHLAEMLGKVAHPQDFAELGIARHHGDHPHSGIDPKNAEGQTRHIAKIASSIDSIHIEKLTETLNDPSKREAFKREHGIDVLDAEQREALRPELRERLRGKFIAAEMAADYIGPTVEDLLAKLLTP